MLFLMIVLISETGLSVCLAISLDSCDIIDFSISVLVSRPRLIGLSAPILNGLTAFTNTGVAKPL